MGTGGVLLSIFWFFLFFSWMTLLFQVFGDIFRNSDVSRWGEATW